MATRAFVGIKEGNKVRAIYNHYDGYPAHLGVVLTKTYNTEEKVRELISLGDCMFIGHRLEPTEGVEHTFENPEKGITIAYHRDRGDDLDITEFVIEDDFESQLGREFLVNFFYLFADGVWNLYKIGEDTTGKTIFRKVKELGKTTGNE